MQAYRLARNLLLFTLLLDNKDAKKQPDYWSVFYDLLVDTDTLNVIRKHALKLTQVSDNMIQWAASPYTDILGIVNSETLSLLREYWLKYANYQDPDRSKFFRFSKQIRNLYEMAPPAFTTQSLQTLGRSFGPRLAHAISITEYYTNQFWKMGNIRPSSNSTARQNTVRQNHQCNPLVMYSSSADDRCALHYRSNPLAGFNLSASLTLQVPDTPHFFAPQKENRDNIPLVAKMQFQAWCTAFQEIAKNISASSKSAKGKLRIRFFVGDAIQFCTGLYQLRLGMDPEDLNMYSRPWSTQPLRFDGPAYTPDSNDKAPLSFNVIDTSSLIDDVGFINLLVTTIPLLENSAASVLYTETLKSAPPPIEQPSLLAELCNGDAGSMCALLGVVPTSYVAGTASHAVDPAYLDDHTPIFSRLNWKIATSIDPNVNVTESKLSCNPENLAKLLLVVYIGMFSHETGGYLDRIGGLASQGSGRMRFPQPHYSRKSFAVLLDFLRSRITVNWTEFWKFFLGLVERDQELAIGKQSIQDLKMQCRMYGFDTLDKLDTSKTIYRHDRGLLKSENPPEITMLIIDIPRRKLRTIYAACVETGHRINMLFKIHLFHKSGTAATTINTFASFQPIFGKYSLSDNTIDRDPTGWFGQSDLHLCAYVPTSLLIQRDPKQCEVVVRLQQEMSCKLLLQDQLGPDLEIFRARLLSGEYLHLVENFPGLRTQKLLPAPVDEAHEFVVSNENVDITYPVLVPGDRTFVTQITLKGEKEHAILNDGQTVSVNQISPCRVAVECRDYKYTCSFPFPVTKPTLEISRELSSLKVIAPLLSHKDNRLSLQIFYPLIHDKRYGLCTWNVPYINFAQLPRIALVEHPNAKEHWLPPHLDGMYSDQECRIPASDTSIPLFEFKKSIYAVLEFIVGSDIWEPCLFSLKPVDTQSGKTLIFIATGICFESTSQSIAAEVYVVEVTDEVFYDPRFIPILAHFAAHETAFELDETCYSMWKRALPAMAEACRDWEHQPSCEYTLTDGATPQGDRKPVLCGCGHGKVKGDVMTVWPYADQFMTRVAISPLFAAPYIEASKGGITSRRKVMHRGGKAPVQAADAPAASATPKCQDCGKEGQKKCGNCGNVYYCSRACQRRDWKKHKAICQKK